MSMRFVSTRRPKDGKLYTFEEAVLAGWADDGGMILPETLPILDASKLVGKSFEDVAFEVLRLFTDNIPDEELKKVLNEAFNDFGCADVVKTRPIIFGDHSITVAELWHGPTLAFKDLGMQVLARILNLLLLRRNERRTIIVGTSGDTGSSACEALAGLPSMSLIVLYPGHGRISAVQELQMSRCKEAGADERYSNIHVVAVDGTSDELDVAVEGNLKDPTLNTGLGSVNSVNIVRVLMQVVSYFFVYANLQSGSLSDEPSVHFYVPTGAAGHITAGAMAVQMGLPIKVVAATNANGAPLAMLIATGSFRRGEASRSFAPAMDIQMPYNIERLLCLYARHAGPPGEVGESVSRWMDALKETGDLKLPNNIEQETQNKKTAWTGFADYVEGMGSQPTGKGPSYDFEAMLEAALKDDTAFPGSASATASTAVSAPAPAPLTPSATEPFSAVGVFSCSPTDDPLILKTIRQVYMATGYLLDPHTSVGVAGAMAAKTSRRDDNHTQDGVRVVVMGCASCAKFPDIVAAANVLGEEGGNENMSGRMDDRARLAEVMRQQDPEQRHVEALLRLCAGRTHSPPSMPSAWCCPDGVLDFPRERQDEWTSMLAHVVKRIVNMDR